MRPLNYREAGSGEPIVIMHGLFGSLDNWMGIAKVLSMSFHVIAIDLRNHGKSFHDNTFDYESMSEDVYELIRELNLKDVSIIGHSMGGKVAMNLAVTYPELLNKLIVVDIAPKFYPVHHETIINGLKSIPVSLIKSRSEADKILSTSINQLAVRQFLLKNLHRTSSGFEWKMNLNVISDNIENVGQSLNEHDSFPGQTLFIRGDNSDYILDDDFATIYKHFPKSDIITIRKAGHWVHAENPTEFIDEVLKFLNN